MGTTLVTFSIFTPRGIPHLPVQGPHMTASRKSDPPPPSGLRERARAPSRRSSISEFYFVVDFATAV